MLHSSPLVFLRLLLSADAAPCHSGHTEQHPAVRRSGLHTEHTVPSARPRPHRQAAQRGPWLHQGPLHSEWTRQGLHIFTLYAKLFSVHFDLFDLDLICLLLCMSVSVCMNVQHPGSVYGRIATASLAETVLSPAPCDSVQEASGHNPSEPLSSKSSPDEGRKKLHQNTALALIL